MVGYVDSMDAVQNDSLAGNDALGSVLVGGNCIAFLIILVAGVRGMRNVRRELSSTRLCEASGQPVSLQPPKTPDGPDGPPMLSP